MSEYDFLNTLKEDLPPDFAQELKAKLDTLDGQKLAVQPTHRTFWTVAAASLVTMLLGIVLVVSRMPQLLTLVVAPSAPKPSFTQHGEITTETIDQLQPFARLGNGMMTGIHMLPDGEHLLITATTGLYLFDAHDLSAEPQQLYEGPISYNSDIDANGNLYGLAENTYAQRDDTIIIARWDSTTGERSDIRHLDNMTLATIEGLQVNPDGSQILLTVCLEFTAMEYFAACTQRGYQWYDVYTGEQLDTIPLPAGNNWRGHAISPDWSYIAYDMDAAESEGLVETVIQLMNRETRETRTVISLSASLSLEMYGMAVIVAGIEFSPDGQFLMTRSFYGQNMLITIYDVAKLWETESPVSSGMNVDAVRYRTSASAFGSYQFFFAPDSRYAFAISNNEIRHYDLTSNERTLKATRTASLYQGLHPHDTPIFAPDGSTFYFRSWGNTVIAYDAETLNKMDAMAHFENDYGDGFQFTQDGSEVAIYSMYGGIPDIWAINSEPPSHETFLPDGILSPTGQFALSPDGNRIIYKSESMWDVSHSLWIARRDSSTPPLELPIEDNVMGLQFLADGTALGIMSGTNTAVLSLLGWSIEDATNDDAPISVDEIPLTGLQSFNLMSTFSKNYTIAPNNQWFALSVCRLNDSSCKRDKFVLWSMETGERITLADEQDFHEYGAMAFSPDSELFAYGYCAEPFVLENTFVTCHVPAVRFYTLEALVTSEPAIDGTIAPEPLFTLTTFTELPTNIAFNPIQQSDGSWLVAITEWNTHTQLWRVYPNGAHEHLRTLDTVQQPVAFDPTGSLMFTTTDTAQTEVWGVPLAD